MADDPARRLSDLLFEPRETMEVELKNWLKIQDDAEHKATLAKAVIALANHGGGYILIGFEKFENGHRPCADRPPSLASYTSDLVNAIVGRYAEPAFHCDVQLAQAPSGDLHPIIVVPGGHRVPIRASRSGPNGQIVKQYDYYIRRLGPVSETPKTGQEWDDLIRRCIANARDELFDQLRLIMGGRVGSVPTAKEENRLAAWFNACVKRWDERVNDLPADSPARMPLGNVGIAYEIAGVEVESLAELKDAIDRATTRHTGWPMFWVPTRAEIAPYVYDGAIECWFGDGGIFDDAAHADFWRASCDGQLFLVRGLQEDTIDNRRTEPGKVFDLTLWIWRVGEALLQAASLARQVEAEQAEISILFSWNGLKGRRLTSIANSRRDIRDHYVASQDNFRTGVTVRADQISDGLPEITAKIIKPLYELFSFFAISDQLIAEELAEMRKNRF